MTDVDQEPILNGNLNHDESFTNLENVDISNFTEFLLDMIGILLNSKDENMPQILTAIEQSDEIIRRFICSVHQSVLVVNRTVHKENDRDDEEKVTVAFSIASEVVFIGEKTSTIVFIKKGPVIDTEKPIAEQVRVNTVSDGNPYETLLVNISKITTPFFKSFINEARRGERDSGDKFAPTVEKNLSEVEVALLHLKQNIEIPDIDLVIDPVIAEVVSKARSQLRKATVADLQDKISDTNFLNQLQNGVNRWIKEIQKVTKLDRDPASGTSLQETAFWLNMERALLKVNQKRESEEVVLTLEALKSGKRFHATVSFDADTGLKERLALVSDYNMIMKDLPLNDLMSSMDLSSINSALQSIFNQFKKFRNSKYPISRAYKLVEVISRDLDMQMRKVLSNSSFMHMKFSDVEYTYNECQKIFTTWEEECARIMSILRDASKKKREDGTTHAKSYLRVNPPHKKLEMRIAEIKKIRTQHEQLRNVVNRVLRYQSDKLGNMFVYSNDENKAPSTDSTNENGVLKQIDFAYETIKNVDAIDTTEHGSERWFEAIKHYEEIIDRVETQIASKLCDQLNRAKDASEMFGIFSNYNALFIRPAIRGAIKQYQDKLIERVKADIQELKHRYGSKLAEQRATFIAMTMYLPTCAAKILWVRQIDRQIQMLMKKVENVLGQSADNHTGGKTLKTECQNFRQLLNCEEIFNEYIESVKDKDLSPAGEKLYTVENRKTPDSKIESILKVNFSTDVITVVNEIRNLKHMNFRIPLKIASMTHQVYLVYPFAVSIIDSIRTYHSVNLKVSSKPSIALLVATYKNEIHSLIEEGSALTWDSYKIEPYAQKLSEVITKYNEKVDELLNVVSQIEISLDHLSICAYEVKQFTSLLNDIQKGIDLLTLGSYSNLKHWVAKIDEDIENRLAYRVEDAINLWDLVLRQSREDIEDAREASKLIPEIMPIELELRLTSQVMQVYPSLEQCKANLYDQLYKWQSVIIGQQRITSNKYTVMLEHDTDDDGTYRHVLKKMPNRMTVLINVYKTIDKVIANASKHIGEWMRYQGLWDMQPDVLFEQLGKDLSKWMEALVDIKKSRHQVDSQDPKCEENCFIFDHTKVQPKVSMKYDFWHREVIRKFGSILGKEMQDFFDEIHKWRIDLESQSVDTGTTSDAVQLITYVQKLKKEAKRCKDTVERLQHGQRLLVQQRFSFPSAWLYVEQVEGEYQALNDILFRKDNAIQTQVVHLQSKIREEDELVEKRIEDVLEEWNKTKPIHGSQKPSEALENLATYETKLNKLREERENMVKAKAALEITSSAKMSAIPNGLDVTMEELNDLKNVWKSLAPIYETVDEMKEKTWLSVQPRKIRQSLDDILEKMKQLPSQFRSYETYDYAKKSLQNYTKVNLIVADLKSDALKDRHWKQLMKELKVNWNIQDLTLGQVWDVDLLKHESVIKQILLVAQGEMALEEFLKQVREFWQDFEVELINYQNKTKLIKGWDDLFNKLKEHMNSLAAMKLSPYYKQFEEDSLSWEEKLNKINALFDVWIDVQRRWVYLDGLFSGSADIASLLPIESGRFGNVSTEFLALMRKVSQSPRILDVVHIQGSQRLLERLADMLAKIQKALGEYLERERSSFPRFYFVGDEDLLEIMGNSKDITRLQKHLKKMFAGIMSIDYNEETKLITSLSSREGEIVELLLPIDLNAYKKINDWLTALEKEMQHTLAMLFARSVADFSKIDINAPDSTPYMNWLDTYPAQIIGISVEAWFTTSIEKQFMQGKDAKSVLDDVEATLSVLSDGVLREQPPIRRKKIELLITEFVHKRDIVRNLYEKKINSIHNFEWLKVMRFYLDNTTTDASKMCLVRMANAEFNYGFEYLGIQEKLVQTPLTDRCYLTMTQALHSRLGGSPFGPAGTGKTESVKALGHQLGRFVLVFNCDETFDFQAIGRILVGLCQVGAWGCFDEFNRLEEKMLSAVSQQIQTIQEAVKAGGDTKVDLVGKNLSVNPNMAIFITMNPGYSGRSNLPDNLKQLFRSLAMTQPDRNLIAEVMLFSQGFRTAETLAKKIVPLFILCKEQLSNQSHYDFGLRALKYVLVSAGNLKRDEILRLKQEALSKGKELSENDLANIKAEQQILIQSVCETLLPKLVSEDMTLLSSLLQDVFPDVQYIPKRLDELRNEICNYCEQHMLCYSTVSGERGAMWLDKVMQLYQITNLNHGLMLVGPSGTGKSTAWKVLLKALERYEKVEGVSHIIDAKAMSKDDLFGYMDQNTREWSDGLFTHIIRKIIDNVRGENSKRQWIIFDGDVDPEWVENLNSVLDDNKLLTLPNGERLSIPSNVRIIFEVSDLKYATLATVSRCGMIWFPEEVINEDMLYDSYLNKLRNQRLDIESNGFSSDSNDFLSYSAQQTTQTAETISMETSMQSASMITSTFGNISSSVTSPSDTITNRVLEIQRICANILNKHLRGDGIVGSTLDYALENIDHIMEATSQRLVLSFFSMMNFSIKQLLEYDTNHQDFPLTNEQIESYIEKTMAVNLVWSMSGDGKWKSRKEISDFVRRSSTFPMPIDDEYPIIDFEVTITGEWQPWSSRVPKIEIESNRVAASDLVIPTMDTVRHEYLLKIWLSERKPLVLCGPPGSGKTMTLLAALRSQQDMDVINVNFSSSTTPELLMKTFDHYCEYKRTPNGVVLAPVQMSRWLVIFCDEINLPTPDKYGTQRVISFLRQLVEQNGFYRTSDHAWVSLERIQFVGACNPPTDPGRHPLTLRFLRHVPIVYVDYPGRTSLIQIYGTSSRAMLRMITSLRGCADALTNAMVDVYLASQEHFTQDDQPHYVYSPRELTRWVRGINEALIPQDSCTVEGLVRLWAHEALRLFQDRLVHDQEREWTDNLIDETAARYFQGNCNIKEALQRPMLYSNWLTKHYSPVTQQDLQQYVQARLKTFYEEELDVKLVPFDQMLDHVLRIDRIYRQPQGHLLLIGVSGSGKTTLSRFVAWLNGLSIVQLKVHSKYSGTDFDEDIKAVLRRAGCKNERICFIMDESNMLDTGFLERLNTLLANGEVPGLFEGDEYTTLMSQIKEGAQRQGLMLDSGDELYKWFTSQIIKNLHIVFTMNPSGDGLREKASTSPALFNRCVINWYGDWSNTALYQVGSELTNILDIDQDNYSTPITFEPCCSLIPEKISYRHAVINSFVQCHNSVGKTNISETKKGHPMMPITPRHYLDFIKHFQNLFHEKRRELEEEKVHLNIGLSKIKETEEQVSELQKSLQLKGKELEDKKVAANAKLKEMLLDQQKAQDEKITSEKLQKELADALVQIGSKREIVQKDLAQVEPAVEEAKQAVKGIKKTQLVELRSMLSPPNPVKLALESICMLLKESVTSDWKTIRSVVVRDDFINKILTFNTDQISFSTLETMRKYTENPEFDYEKVNRASVACGPLLKWVKAQLLYSEMLNKVGPLRNELMRLEKDAELKTKKGEEVKQTIVELEQRIAAYKEEYAVLIGQGETIKADLATVKEKVQRSIDLLGSLRSEYDRWSRSCDGFSHQMETLIGDTLLSAAFLAYSGYYDQRLRDELFNRWFVNLQQNGVKFRNEISRIEYLSNVDDRLQWNNNGLPKDELCTENSIMLHRFNRFPLIIDPSGQAMDFMLRQFANKNIIKTSFLDDSFKKNLESALRFGNTLLVQDVESYDPVLNPVLNREVKKTGGRILITIGDQDIDLSPAFQIYLITRDASVQFSPDVCSRVTFVNFTITRGSLETQCLNQVLKSERPDIDEKRSDLLKLQGEFAVRLRQLEKALLSALNESKGKILDDNSVISTLEKLKKEAQEVAKKAAETDQVMMEVELASQKYVRLAHACSLIYLMLHQLEEVHFLYHYSLDFLLDIFTVALHSPQLKGVEDYGVRLSIITTNLFQIVYKRVSLGMLHVDKVVLAILLLRIYLKGEAKELSYEPQFDHLLFGSDLIGSESSKLKADVSEALKKLPFLSHQQIVSLIKLTTVPGFKNIISKIESIPDFKDWLKSDNPETSTPEVYETAEPLTDIGKAVYNLLLIHAMRPDRVVASSHLLVCSGFGSEFMQQDKVVNLREIVENEVQCKVPILLCSAVGFDASGKVEDLAVEMNREVTSIAIGSSEGFNQADAALNSSSKTGKWILLKNVHLAPSWLAQLEKKLHTLRPHPNFRLLLTAEIHPKLPISVVKASRVLVYEPASGLKANLLRSLSSISGSRISKLPHERSRLYFLVCWLHSIVQERLRYTPLGWANTYEFSDADLRVACDTLDAAVDINAAKRSNVDPEKLPWSTLQTLLSQCIYGGKIDNKFDQKLLDCFINKLFTSKSFGNDYVLIKNMDGKNSLTIPETNTKDGFVSWVSGLSPTQMPSWIGLPNNAERVLLTERGQYTLKNLLKMSGDELAYDDETDKKNAPSWMITLSELATKWLNLLPESIDKLKRNKDNIKDSLFRFFEREVNLGAALLRDVRHDLIELKAVCKGDKKQDNNIRSLSSSLNRGLVPQNWQRYVLPKNVTVASWMADFAERISQLVRLSKSDNLRSEEIWLGGMFAPEAYITATRQMVAQSNGLALEQLNMHVKVGKENKTPDSFSVKGLIFIGGKCQPPNNVIISDDVYNEIDTVHISWLLDKSKTLSINLPVYLYNNRTNLLFTLDFVPEKEKEFEYYERGVAIVANSVIF
ncbi:Dynein heavy chain, cytoplasmic [Strongyloides ratti]|uniref:Dynein heavy chain, cytoplasmic n=1 Tax=Strongyloides ratti TaxID=34506 RepID=A0A090LFP1_STRRB|nr:Dynein heavy chain, cytoplasmic [Strongyloides ratti]CEF66963.1 Dynein heavy chain, cytoplasmic [Strongyloides ratti]